MMNRAATTKPRPQRSPWQNLLAPMLLASLGLHGLFLLMPTGVSSEAPIPPPDPEQDSIAITRVPPSGTTDPAATPTPAGTAPAASVPAPQPLGSQSSPQSLSRVVAPASRATPRARQLAPQPRSQRPAPTPSSSAPSQPSTPTASSGSTAPPSTATPPAPSSTSQPLFNAEIGDRLLAYVATLDLPQAQVDQVAAFIQNRFAFDAAAVTREAFNTNQQRWEAAIRQDNGQANLTPEINRTEFSTVYPQRVCLSDTPGQINVGAVVNPDGSWRGEPTLLRSSGYGALDRKALQAIQNHTFAPADDLRAYVLTVETSVDYGPRPCLDPNTDI